MGTYSERGRGVSASEMMVCVFSDRMDGDDDGHTRMCFAVARAPAGGEAAGWM